MSHFRATTTAAAASIFLLTLNACGATDAADTNEDTDTTENTGDAEAQEGTDNEADQDTPELTIVTSTDVYADLVTGIAGDAAEVEALVTSTATDPHSYEATPQDRLKVENADVVFANGAGYDSFITLLASAAEKDDAVYDVAERVAGVEDSDHDHDHDHDDHGNDEDDDHGHEHDDEDEDSHAEDEHDDHGHGHDDEHNHDDEDSDDHGDHDPDHSHDGEYQTEHFWYDLALMEEFVLDAGDHLGELLPEHADHFGQNADDLAQQISELAERNRGLDAADHTYLATEGVSGYLLDDAGFDNLTDTDFLNAVEHGDDVSPRLYSQAMDLAEEADLLSYNSQTETQQSSRIRTAAEEAETVVIEFTESLPEDGAGYIEWMESNIELVETALEDIR